MDSLRKLILLYSKKNLIENAKNYLNLFLKYNKIVPFGVYKPLINALLQEGKFEESLILMQKMKKEINSIPSISFFLSFFEQISKFKNEISGEELLEVILKLNVWVKEIGFELNEIGFEEISFLCNKIKNKELISTIFKKEKEIYFKKSEIFLSNLIQKRDLKSIKVLFDEIEEKGYNLYYSLLELLFQTSEKGFYFIDPQIAFSFLKKNFIPTEKTYFLVIHSLVKKNNWNEVEKTCKRMFVF